MTPSPEVAAFLAALVKRARERRRKQQAETNVAVARLFAGRGKRFRKKPKQWSQD